MIVPSVTCVGCPEREMLKNQHDTASLKRLETLHSELEVLKMQLERVVSGGDESARFAPQPARLVEGVPP